MNVPKNRSQILWDIRKALLCGGSFFRHKASKETENICGVCFVLLWFVNLEMGSCYVALADRSSLSRPNLELPEILLPLPTAFSDCFTMPDPGNDSTSVCFYFLFLY